MLQKHYRFFGITIVTLALLVVALMAVTTVAAQSGSITGVVYCDSNQNWQVDPGEELAGLTVTLYDDALCDRTADLPARSTQNTLGDGTYSFTGLQVGGSTYAERVCYVVEANAADPALGTCNFIVQNPSYPYFYGENLQWGQDFRFERVWDKLVNGQPWVPDFVVTTETSDTVEIVDLIYLPSLGQSTEGVSQEFDLIVLVETWNPAELDLTGVLTDSGTVVQGNGVMTWTLEPFNNGLAITHTLTKTFHVEPSTWTSTQVKEELFFELRDEPDAGLDQVSFEVRTVTVQKTAPDLYIDSTNSSPEVSPGTNASFVLDYGNNGGYENSVMIRNDFPAKAPFVSSIPAPDRTAVDKSWAEWDVGDLANGVSGSIDVTVAIQAGLTPSTTIPITDVIVNHVGQVADTVVTTFHILQPPLSLGDFVWYDTDQDGIQDAGEPGIAGIDVSLHRRLCSEPALATDVTDANGNYLFENLQPGIYCLQFASIPSGWFISPQNQGADDTVDSDADPTTAQIANINLTVDDLDEDMGLYAEGSIGDTVFCDQNNSGQYEAGEGVAGVAVTLHDDPGCDGAPINLIGTEDTVGDGQYLFDGLAAGPPGGQGICYVVAVDENDPDLGDCNQPMTPLSWAVQLEANNPDDPDNDFGFNHGEPTPTPTSTPTATPTPTPTPSPTPTISPEPPAVVPEASTLLLLGGAATSLAGYAGLQYRARRRKRK